MTNDEIGEALAEIDRLAAAVMAATRGRPETGRLPGAMSNIRSQVTQAEGALGALRKAEPPADDDDGFDRERAEAESGRALRDQPDPGGIGEARAGLQADPSLFG